MNDMSTSGSSCCGAETQEKNNSCSCSCSCEQGTSKTLTTTSTITLANTWDHILARLGVSRMEHRVVPGLYQLGHVSPNSPVIVTANYTLSFDAVRSNVPDGTFILVLDTKGINVWCAAGKGTFGTDELIRRIKASNLESIVTHRELILPELGAPGISAHEVLHQTGFRVKYGPVRATDLTSFITTGNITEEMRTVQFSFPDRIVLTPVETRHVLIPMIIGGIIMYLLAGDIAALGVLVAVLSGTILFPAFLPFLPYADFSIKGLILGVITALPVAGAYIIRMNGSYLDTVLVTLVFLLLMPAITAYLALNFTGCTPYTSRTGVKKEIFRYVPILAGMAGLGFIIMISIGIKNLGVF